MLERNASYQKNCIKETIEGINGKHNLQGRFYMISTEIFEYISEEELNELFDNSPIYGIRKE